MSGVFEHSIKVPRLYKTVGKIVQTVREDGASLKQLVYLKQHPNIKALYALALTSLQHGSQLDQLIRRTKILVNEPRLDPWLARVLITELLWGKKHLSSECKPVQTVISYEKLLKDELKNIESFDTPGNKLKVEKPRYVRVNTLSMSVDEAIKSLDEEGWRPLYRSKDYTAFIEAVSNLSGAAFIQDIHIPELLIFPPRTQFYNHPGYTSGALILQDKASCLPAYLLNAQPGSTVLDMCASPGMKTTHLAAMLNNEGKIYAVEIDKRRYQTLCEIVNSTNSYCVETINADVMTLDAQRCLGVEYILVDPSCSGSGMLDRLEIEYSSMNEKCAPGRLKNLQSFQIIILRHALLNFPTAKRIVYSTCSIHPEENEQVVDDVLSQVGDSYRLISAKKLMNNNWLNYSSSEYTCKDNCLYARSETDLSNGFFVAVFERNFDIPLPVIKRKKNKKLDIETGVKNEENENNFKEENIVELNVKKIKKKKKRTMREENEEEKNLKHENEEAIIDNRDRYIEDGTVSKKVKRGQRKDSINAENGAENKSKNNYDQVISTTRIKSKRKYEHDDIIETVDNIELKLQNNVIAETESKKRKKKCKKSRTENREQSSDEIIEENKDETVYKRKSTKKSKKKYDLVEIDDKVENESPINVSDDINQIHETIECKDNLILKKHKKNK